MMATPHMMAGAAIGKAVGRAWVAWPVALASHFLLDAVPHLDSANLYGVKDAGPTVPEAAIAVADFVLGCLLIAWLVWHRPRRGVLLGAALCAIIIDLVDNVPPIETWFEAWPVTAGLSSFHQVFQKNVTPDAYPLGIATQVAALGVALWILLPRPRRDGAPTSE
jgi:hypothetical protein